MVDKSDNLILEHLKAIRVELSDVRERNKDMLKRLVHLEAMVANMGRDLAEMVA